VFQPVTFSKELKGNFSSFPGQMGEEKLPQHSLLWSMHQAVYRNQFNQTNRQIWTAQGSVN